MSTLVTELITDKGDHISYYFLFIYLVTYFILLSRESDQSAIRTRLEVASHLSATPRWDYPAKCLSQRHNKYACRPACPPHCTFNAECQAGKL